MYRMKSFLTHSISVNILPVQADGPLRTEDDDDEYEVHDMYDDDDLEDHPFLYRMLL